LYIIDLPVHLIQCVGYPAQPDLRSFPTRRSSDLDTLKADALVYISGGYFGETPKESTIRAVRRFFRYYFLGLVMRALGKPVAIIDRKSTRLNSSHVKISYAVLCLTKKKETLTFLL